MREQSRSEAIRKQLSVKLYASDQPRVFSEGEDTNAVIAVFMEEVGLWLGLEEHSGFGKQSQVARVECSYQELATW